MINATINFTLNATIFTAIAYFGFCLIASMVTCVQARKNAYTANPSQAIEAPSQTIEAPSIVIVNEAPSQDIEAPSSPCYSTMSVTELRKVCSSLGIVWRNVYGKNKHLKKSEMLTLIMV
jgi:hypothetical protein